MPDKKLTDAEIVRAFECCNTRTLDCDKCPSHYKKEKFCLELDNLILDLINRYEEENKNLKAEVERLKNHTKEGIDLAKQIPEMLVLTKAEAYKEFAKELEDIYHFAVCNARGKCKLVERKNLKWYVDNILLKLAGDKNAGEN